MTRSLSRWQGIVLGLFILSSVAAASWAMFRIGSKSGFFHETYEVVVYVPDAQDVDTGAPVRIRGVEAGKVIAVEYPEVDGDESMIRLRLQLDKKFEERLFADATASIVSKGLLGTSFIAIQPGKPLAGPLTSKTIRSQQQPDLAEVTAKLASVTTRMDNVLKQVEAGQGTVGKLLQDDSLYRDIKALSGDARQLIAGTNDAIYGLRSDAQFTMTNAQKAMDGINTTLTSVQGEMAGVRELVRTSKEAVSAIKQDAEAIKSMPLVRSYVTDEVKVLIRPNCQKERVVYAQESLFETGRAVLTESGRHKIGEAAAWLRGQKPKGSEVVVASFADPSDKNETSASARELTKQRSEVVAALLKEYGATKLSTWSSRSVTPVGLGFEPPPNVEKEELPASRTEIILFAPQ